MTLGERISTARTEASLTQAALSKLVGVGQSTIAQWESGKNEPKIADIQKVARATGKNATWLAFGIEVDAGAQPSSPTDAKMVEYQGEDFVAIPVYDVRAAAGHGAWNDSQNIASSSLFRMQWLRSRSSADIDDLAVVRVDGDSMEPTLRDGDNVLIDLTQNRPRHDGIYVFQFDGALLVKRIRVDPVRRLMTITSDNPNYHPISDVDPSEVNVTGRVIWIGRSV